MGKHDGTALAALVKKGEAKPQEAATQARPRMGPTLRSGLPDCLF